MAHTEDMENNTDTFIDNTAWLAGYDAFMRGDSCPWGNTSLRRGWLQARCDSENAE